MQNFIRAKRRRPKSPGLIAMIVGWDGQARRGVFSDRRLAIQWLEGDGAASFGKGNIERLELYSKYMMLIWTKSLA